MFPISDPRPLRSAMRSVAGAADGPRRRDEAASPPTARDCVPLDSRDSIIRLLVNFVILPTSKQAYSRLAQELARDALTCSPKCRH